MPLFKHKEPEPVQTAPPPRNPEHARSSGRGFFSRRRSSSPSMTSSNSSVSPVGRSSTTSTRNRHSMFNRHNDDPSIIGARERVSNAEAAEREADRALAAARIAVKEAREHARRLEHEAAEEARLARIKQGQAADISKKVKPLGRHG